jgi:phosphate uptake regulator
MSAMQAEVFEAFRAIDVPEDKALRAAAALASAITKSEDETARSFAKRDSAVDKLTAEVVALGAKLTAEVSALNARMAKLEGDVALLKWMVGFSLAMTVTLLFRVFTH